MHFFDTKTHFFLKKFVFMRAFALTFSDTFVPSDAVLLQGRISKKILPYGAIHPKLRSLNAANMQKNAPKINYFAILFAYLHFL